MVTLIILILAISLDALSFGIAQGLKKNTISLFCSLCMTILSTILFTIPLYLSTLVSKYMDAKICYIINGTVLIGLGIFYITGYFIKIYKQKKLEIELQTNNKLSVGYCLISTLAISLDAIFTAFLSNINLNLVVFAICFYFIVTFLAIYASNKVALKMTGQGKLKIEWLSGVIFVVLGILKIFGM